MARKEKTIYDISDSAESTFLRLASQYADDGLVIQSLEGVILWANSAYSRMMGHRLSEIVGRNPLEFCMPDDERPTAEEIAAFRYDPSKSGVAERVVRRNRRKSGALFWNEMTQAIQPLEGGEVVAILVCRDVSDRVETEQMLRETSEKLAQLASRDTLTGLANRSTLMRVLNDYLSAGRTSQVGLLQLDLDHFKGINDTHGHSAGDAILRHVGKKLQHVIQEGGLAARMGGDEFVIFCPNISTENDLMQFCSRIAQAIDQPFRWRERTLHCSASLGAVLVATNTMTDDEMLRRADFALYEAKRRGRNTIALYDSDLHSRHLREEQMSAELIATIEADGLDFVFQPLFNVVTGHVRGFETLVRWQHPRLGLIAPDQFLPLAARLGVMAQIDFAAIRAAFALKAQLNMAGYRDIRIGVNGSAELLGTPDFFEQLVQQMERFAILPTDVAIEVLETVVFTNLNTDNPLVAIIQRLHDAGVQTFLDDFGTGYAGLTHLAHLAVHGVKIDRSMTCNLLTDPTSAKIISMILELCTDLGLQVAIEGIETSEQASALVKMGGTLMQGYWLARPMPAAAVFGWLHSRPDFVASFDRSAIAPAPQPRYLGANF